MLCSECKNLRNRGYILNNNNKIQGVININLKLLL